MPDDLKNLVQSKATELVEQVLKPQHVTPQPDEPRFNYIIDLWSRWHQSYFSRAGPGTSGTIGKPDRLVPMFSKRSPSESLIA